VSEQPRDHAQVLATRHRALDRRVLAGEADDPPNLLGSLDDVDALHLQRPRRRRDQRGDRADERGLPGAVGPEDGEHLPGRDREVQPGERFHLAESFGQPRGFDHQVHTRSIPTIPVSRWPQGWARGA
jgi:hypothetical protein